MSCSYILQSECISLLEGGNSRMQRQNSRNKNIKLRDNIYSVFHPRKGK